MGFGTNESSNDSSTGSETSLPVHYILDHSLSGLFILHKGGYSPAVLRAKPLQNAYAIERFSCEFTGYKIVVPIMTEETKRKVMQQTKKRIDELALDDRSNKNLLEIKLKDTDSVPEVYYKGQRMDEMPRGLIDITYHWHTEDDEYQVPRGVNDITIEYYDSPNNKYLDRKIIGHKRDM